MTIIGRQKELVPLPPLGPVQLEATTDSASQAPMTSS